MLNSKARLTAASIAVAAAAFATGCSGSSTGSAAMPAVPQPANASAPSPWPSAGTTLEYRGSLTQTGSGSTIDLAVDQQVTTGSATLHGHPAIVYHGKETESGKGSSETIAYDAEVLQRSSETRKGSDVVLVKFASHASSGLRETIEYGGGNGVFDQLPHVPQARWTNTAARTDSIFDSVAGSSLHDDYRADGSYAETGVPVEGRTSLAQSYPDGNALYQWPFEGGSYNSTIAISPPSKGAIHIVFTNAAAHVTEYAQLRDWYPRVPPLLASDAFVDLGTTAVPSACGTSKAYGKSATALSETRTRLDIIYGEYETTDRTSYVAAPYGVVCLIVHDDLKVYYDYTTFALVGKPLTETVTDETLGLRKASATNAALAEASAGMPLDAGMTARSAAARTRAAEAIYHSLHFVRRHR